MTTSPTTAAQCPVAELAANFDFTDPATRANANAVYAELRQGPPKWSEAFGGFWVATRYADVMTVLEDPELFCSGQGTNLPPNGFPYRLLPEEADPPAHAKWRKLAAPFFTSKAVNGLEAAIRGIARDRLASFVEKGSADLSKDFAMQIPAYVIADMMGFPREDAPWFAETSDRLLATAERPELAEENAALGADLVGYLGRHLEARKDGSHDDLLSELVHGQFEDRPLTPEELFGISFFFLIAGHETTVGGISYMLWRLALNPEQRSRLVADPSLIPQAVDESLRLDGPVLHLSRVATRDTDLGGSPVKTGDRVMLLYAAANLDENTFPNPDDFDIDRANARRHVAFGGGIHRCQGATLGKLEMQIAIEEVLATIPDYVVDFDAVEFRSLQGARSVSSLPVTFAPTAPPG